MFTASTVQIFSANIAEMDWIERTGINAGSLRPCDDCTSEEIIPLSPFPFGEIYNGSIYVSQCILFRLILTMIFVVL